MNINENQKIICGFPGTGKTYFKGYVDGSCYAPQGYCEDSDSSYFDKQNFPKNYVDHIEELIKKGTNIIFISTHKEVREELVKRGINFYLVYPKKELKEEYMQRYIERGSQDAFINLMRNNWNNFIEQLENQENCIHVVLDSKEYMYNKF